MAWKRLVIRGVLIAVGLAILAAVLWRIFAPPYVDAIRPIRGPAVRAVYATGTVEPSIEVRIAPRVAGRLIELRADEGQQVKAGEVLARLEDTDVRASVSELQARLREAELHYQRIETLAPKGWVTKAARDQARADYKAAQAALQRAEAQVKFMWLRAPAAGAIIRRDGEVGDFIPINETVFYMAQAGAPMRISAEVDEEDVPLVRVGQRVLVRADAFPDDVFDGWVKEITPRGDPTARSYRVRVGVPENTPLRFGMTAETNIIVARKNNALLVPTNAVDKGAVWVVKDNRLERRTVTLGVRGDARVEVEAGLTEADVIVVDPADSLKEGQRVRVRTVSAEAAPAGGGAR